MRREAEITINGSKLTDNQAMVMRVALETLADVLANEVGFKDDGIPLTDQYQTDLAYVRALIEGRTPRAQ